MKWIARTVDRLDQVGLGWLLLPNAFIALWVLFAHGGAVLLVRLGKLPASAYGGSLDCAYWTVVPAAVLLVLTVIAWLRPPMRLWVLRIQAACLLLFAAYVLYYALDIVISGIPKGTRFVWSMGAFIFILAYPAYLARRTLFTASALRNPAVHYAHVIAILIAVVVSLLVFRRLDGAV